jgi:hypothetical protein
MSFSTEDLTAFPHDLPLGHRRIVQKEPAHLQHLPSVFSHRKDIICAASPAFDESSNSIKLASSSVASRAIVFSLKNPEIILY